MNEQNYIERYWRDATPEDAIKEPPMVARFRDDDGRWIEKNFRLLGWSRLGTRNNDCLWYGYGIGCYKQCQVYDAPDPGEGWRLVDVENETKQEGDEYLGLSGVWRKADMNPFCPRDTYRRRIAPTVTYVPFTWEDRVQLRGRWIGSNDGRCQRSINTMHNDNGIFYLCAINAELLCTDWHFIDTGEPVGKKVAQ